MEDMLYKCACLYMGKTEIFDRKLTDVRNPYDDTEAWLISSERMISSKYCSEVLKNIRADYGYMWSEINKEIHNHSHYNAQMWVDEYLRLWT